MHPSSHIAQLSISSQSPAKWSGEVIADSSSGQTDSEVNFRPPQAQYFETEANRPLATEIVIFQLSEISGPLKPLRRSKANRSLATRTSLTFFPSTSSDLKNKSRAENGPKLTELQHNSEQGFQLTDLQLGTQLLYSVAVSNIPEVEELLHVTGGPRPPSLPAEI